MRGSGGRGAVDGKGFSQVHTSPLIQEGMFSLVICCGAVRDQNSSQDKTRFCSFTGQTGCTTCEHIYLFCNSDSCSLVSTPYTDCCPSKRGSYELKNCLHTHQLLVMQCKPEQHRKYFVVFLAHQSVLLLFTFFFSTQRHSSSLGALIVTGDTR